MTSVLMPQVGENLKTGVVVEWFKAEMEPVEKGEALLAVESEKAVLEVEAEVSGVLLKILHGQGEEVGVLEPVAYIGRPDEAAGDISEEDQVAIGTEPSGRDGEAAAAAATWPRAGRGWPPRRAGPAPRRHGSRGRSPRATDTAIPTRRWRQPGHTEPRAGSWPGQSTCGWDRDQEWTRRE